MSEQVIGYVRVSSLDQRNERQLVGIDVDLMFEDALSGSVFKRPGFNAMLEYIREGENQPDTIGFFLDQYIIF